ncbi:hypothetical protein [Actinoplanes sp. TFC3]|nr:hypothetical protein [Actinoplanes sp. TFC3]
MTAIARKYPPAHPHVTFKYGFASYQRCLILGEGVGNLGATIDRQAFR